MRALLEILYVVLPFACVAAVPASSGPGAAARRLVMGVALYQAILVGIGLGLGTVGRLTPAWTAAAHAIALAALAWVGAVRGGWRGEAPSRPLRVRQILRTRRGVALLGLGSGVAIAMIVQLGLDALRGTRHSDGLIYHVPRVLAWAGRGGFTPWPTPTWQQIGLPVAGDVILGTRVFLGLGWAGAALGCAWITLGAIGAVYAIGLELGLERSRAVLAALLFASFPAVGFRVAAWNTDVCAAFPLLAAAVIVLRVPRTREDGSAGGPAAVAAAVGLAAMSIACKPTLALIVLMGAAAAAIRLRARRREPAIVVAAVAAALAGSAAILASYWPIYRAFGDFAGGAVGRGLGVRGVDEAMRSSSAALAHWVLEPLGYAPPGLRGWLPGLVERVYGGLGVLEPRFGVARWAWEPLPSPDSGRTAFASVLALPVLVALLPRGARGPVAAVGAAMFLGVTAPIYPQPWSGRFTIPLLAWFALLWVAPPVLARARGRWIPIGVAATCVAGLVATTSYLAFFDARRERFGQVFHYLGAGERPRLAAVLHGEPLCVVGGGANEVLLAGPARPFALRYLTCPVGTATMLPPGERGGCSAVALVHLGRDRVATGSALPAPSPPGACPPVELAPLRARLAARGWSVLAQNTNVDVWVRGAAGAH
ncbi:conserved hypothetical protein [Anaeromyxobacter dehalogenans 2CP-1]|uniref:Glycosyltransferase RgtA/B/C/D-like domain-containing protein n=1 Tax=Anaeromyxobacter dehalogenans (strain ATCC BAA-258 / DSM 21875 / 2CP-1) TaxID=455488 RepID=B8JGW8_ANAD2|nr:hypothetical protein [Anaeromyxobacter dehalogenans]ACL66605.1 conserved hypothetical protein [Anaeromyxobacter dehalogenans 2CP-1]